MLQLLSLSLSLAAGCLLVDRVGLLGLARFRHYDVRRSGRLGNAKRVQRHA